LVDDATLFACRLGSKAKMIGTSAVAGQGRFVIVSHQGLLEKQEALLVLRGKARSDSAQKNH